MVTNEIGYTPKSSRELYSIIRKCVENNISFRYHNEEVIIEYESFDYLLSILGDKVVNEQNVY